MKDFEEEMLERELENIQREKRKERLAAADSARAALGFSL